MQRYSGISQSDVSTWSIDNVTVSVWDGTCLKTVLQEGFESASFVYVYQCVVIAVVFCFFVCVRILTHCI